MVVTKNNIEIADLYVGDIASARSCTYSVLTESDSEEVNHERSWLTSRACSHLSHNEFVAVAGVPSHAHALIVLLLRYVSMYQEMTWSISTAVWWSSCPGVVKVRRT